MEYRRLLKKNLSGVKYSRLMYVSANGHRDVFGRESLMETD